MAYHQIAPGVEILESAYTEKAKKFLKPELINLIAKFHRQFNSDRIDLLASREARQQGYDKGEVPSYLDQKSTAVSSQWKVRDLPKDLLKRRVEITGPVNDTKMVINMLSRNDQGARADTAMVDFEDSMKPSWNNVIDGIENVIGAAEGNLKAFKMSGSEIIKEYRLDPKDMALPMVRVRGLHLPEKHILIDGETVSGGLFDLTSCFFLTAKTLIGQGKTPKYYVPKCEHYLEARWWESLFCAVEKECGLPLGTLRATFLIETLPAAFQIEEILYEIREHAAALNVGRWDKIFSDIKVLKTHKDRITGDRSTIGMNKFWMDNYAKRLIKICHERGALAIGGMSAFTPGKDAATRDKQTAKVRSDKQNEASIGHDGCWVSHPYFIGIALEAFTKDNQRENTLPNFNRCPDLLMKGEGPRTLDGLRTNVRVGIAYMRGWNSDIGCVAWDDLMEDLATLEISRAQTWQWLHHNVKLESGEIVDSTIIRTLFKEELKKILQETPTEDHQDFILAAKQAESLFLQEKLANFFNEALEVNE